MNPKNLTKGLLKQIVGGAIAAGGVVAGLFLTMSGAFDGGYEAAKIEDEILKESENSSEETEAE